MNKKITLLGIVLLILFASSLSSAYYYGDGGYDSYSSSSTRSRGSNYGPIYTRSTDFNRYTTSQILPDGTYETTTHYMRTNRESPNYGYYGNNNRYYTYPAYSNYNNLNYQYDNYPWYRRYWNYDNYPRYSSSYMPRMYFSGYAW